MMFNKLKEILPGTIVSLLITVVSTTLVFWGNYSALKAEVLNNSEQLKNKSDKKEVDLIIQSNEKILQAIDKRLDRVENKIDRMYERIR